MKRVILSLFLLMIALLIMIGADFRAPKNVKQDVIIKKYCVGYSVLEAGVGLDCNGDTVALVRKNGFYELASRYEHNVEAILGTGEQTKTSNGI